MNNQYFSVLTGDLIGYSKLKGHDRENLLDVLKNVLKEIERNQNGYKEKNRFGIFRGDSFQGLITDISKALIYALKIKSRLKSFSLGDSRLEFDARIAVGIGKVDNIKKNISESDGEAFRLSGPALDKMVSQNRLKIVTPDKDLNEEFNLMCLFMDAIINRWTQAQSEVMYYLLDDMNQVTIAEKLKVSQAAINQRIMAADWYVIDAALSRYKKIIIKRFSQ